MVAGARRDDAAGGLVWRQLRDLVVGAAELETEDRLQVLALEEHRVTEPARETGRGVERGLTRDVVDAARKDVVEERGARRIQPAKSISIVRIVRIVRSVRIVRGVRIVLVLSFSTSVRGRSVLATRAAI